MEPPKKIDILRGYMNAGDWPRALALAARFPRLGEHKADIQRAHQAIAHPRFFEGLGRNIDDLIAAGIAALRARYPDKR